jgi:hypothetical protein
MTEPRVRVIQAVYRQTWHHAGCHEKLCGALSIILNAVPSSQRKAQRHSQKTTGGNYDPELWELTQHAS